MFVHRIQRYKDTTVLLTTIQSVDSIWRFEKKKWIVRQSTKCCDSSFQNLRWYTLVNSSITSNEINFTRAVKRVQCCANECRRYSRWKTANFFRSRFVFLHIWTLRQIQKKSLTTKTYYFVCPFWTYDWTFLSFTSDFGAVVLKTAAARYDMKNNS